MGSCYKVSTICWNSCIPLLIVRSYGFAAYCRIQIREHDIMEAKTDAEITDLRIDEPFKELLVCHDFFHRINLLHYIL